MAAPSSPFVLLVRDLVHRPGELREREMSFPAPEQLGQGAAVVAEGAPLHIDVRLEGLHEGILVSGEVQAVATGECVRCLDPVEIDIDADIRELYSYAPDEAYDFTVVEDRIDLEPLVRDAIVLALPFQPLCRPDCPGLDPATGEKRAAAPAGEAPAGDPRWAALEGFRPEE